MNPPRFLACLEGAAALVLSGYAYLQYVYQLGFPDHGITELGFAERKLAVVFVSLSTVAGAALLALGAVAASKNIGRRLVAVTGLYACMLVVFACIDGYYQAHLPGGGGG